MKSAIDKINQALLDGIVEIPEITGVEISAIRKLILATRNWTLEEAATVADAHRVKWDGTVNYELMGRDQAASSIADAIRALKKEGGV